MRLLSNRSKINATQSQDKQIIAILQNYAITEPQTVIACQKQRQNLRAGGTLTFQPIIHLFQKKQIQRLRMLELWRTKMICTQVVMSTWWTPVDQSART